MTAVQPPLSTAEGVRDEIGRAEIVLSLIDRAVKKKNADVVLRHAETFSHKCAGMEKRNML
jgi:hypothetical protein